MKSLGHVRHPTPFTGAWWIDPGTLLAGCYPGDVAPAEADRKLRALIDSGIRCVISLQEDDELGRAGKPFVPYAERLQQLAREADVDVDYRTFPIADQAAPNPAMMYDILETIDASIEAGRPVYLHCWGGHGRTGTVAGCWLIRNGMSAAQALHALTGQRRDDPHLRRYDSPQSEAQYEFVLDWDRKHRDGTPMARGPQEASAGATLRDRFEGCLVGTLVGDALGVPVEFLPRSRLEEDPVTDMRGYGTHYQPPGTWSDDGALTLATLASLLRRRIDFADMMGRFRAWRENGYLSAHDDIFDIGLTTAQAIDAFAKGTPPLQCGPNDEAANGNGSLMRLSPLALYVFGDGDDAIIRISSDASKLTHGHIRAQLACAFYSLLIKELLTGAELPTALAEAGRRLEARIPPEERQHFTRLLDGSILSCDADEVRASGYVIHTLEASVWCCGCSQSFSDAVLRAVNLGEDSDTTGAVTGSLAGVIYGFEAIPVPWRQQLAKRAEVHALAKTFAEVLMARHSRGATRRQRPR